MAWTTLFELSKVAPEALEEALEAGAVTSHTSRAEAVAMTSKPMDDLTALEVQIQEAQHDLGVALRPRSPLA